MDVKKVVKIFLFFICLISLLYFFYYKFYRIDKNTTITPTTNINNDANLSYNSNIIEDVNYKSSDAQGNQYIISAKRGEIDYSEPNILFLTDVTALIKLKNSDRIEIASDFGKYPTGPADITTWTAYSSCLLSGSGYKKAWHSSQ